MVYKDRKIGPLEAKAQKTAGRAFLPRDIDASILQTLVYEYPKRKINVELSSDEFTCLCPYSGLPDFARLLIRYTPRRKLIELKSLKYYLYSYRNVKICNEHGVNKILEDLVAALKPRTLTIEAEFTSRGGIANRVTANYEKK